MSKSSRLVMVSYLSNAALLWSYAPVVTGGVVPPQVKIGITHVCFERLNLAHRHERNRDAEQMGRQSPRSLHHH
ncbi:hypothetical protein ABH909_003953 [Pseudomonas sp. BS3782 TE3695]|uniref:hypothetical protein n=1 Tax=Pseudomonas sp. BS3782 TE3695 TaxID=3349323 RepID=UPI003D1C5CE3